LGACFCECVGEVITGDVGVGGGPNCGEYPATNVECLSSEEGVVGKLVVFVVVGQRLDCGLIVDANVNGGRWCCWSIGEEMEAFADGM
jgi:hypothetical protein